MYTLRLVPALLEDLDVDEEPSAPATTRLGDWDVVPLDAAGRALLVCVSARTDLTIVLPRPDIADLPEALGIALVPVLRALAIGEDGIAAELDEMTTGIFGTVIAPGRLLRASALSRRVARWIAQAHRRPVDVVGLHAMLCAQTSGRRQTIAGRTRAAFGMPTDAR